MGFGKLHSFFSTPSVLADKRAQWRAERRGGEGVSLCFHHQKRMKGQLWHSTGTAQGRVSSVHLSLQLWDAGIATKALNTSVFIPTPEQKLLLQH